MDFYDIKDICRSKLNKYTRRAFTMIPETDNPNILDIGCGTGIPTMEIARISNGKILAIDNDEECVKRLKKKILMYNFEGTIEVLQESVLSIKLEESSFDIIIAEGLLNIIGFKKGLGLFTKNLKNQGYFLIHDEYSQREEKVKIIKDLGYNIINEIILNEEIWWNEYYRCLEKNLPDHKEIKSEIEMYKKDPELFRSRYYILQKIN